MHSLLPTPNNYHQKRGATLLELIVCFPLSIFLLYECTTLLTQTTRKLSSSALIQNNSHNLAWRLARSIEDDINSAPLEVKHLITIRTEFLPLSLSSFPPINESNIIITSRLNLLPLNHDPPPSYRYLGICPNGVSEYSRSYEQIQNSTFGDDCVAPTAFITLLHTRIYYVDQSNTLRQATISGDQIIENQALSHHISAITLTKDGIELTTTSGRKSASVIITRTTQLPLESFVQLVHFFLSPMEQQQ